MILFKNVWVLGATNVIMTDYPADICVISWKLMYLDHELSSEGIKELWCVHPLGVSTSGKTTSLPSDSILPSKVATIPKAH